MVVNHFLSVSAASGKKQRSLSIDVDRIPVVIEWNSCGVQHGQGGGIMRDFGNRPTGDGIRSGYKRSNIGR